MNDLLNNIFGLHGMGFGEEAVELGFARPIPAWGWLIAIVVAAALAWWSYRRLDGSAVSRTGLAALRALALLLILFLISGPQLMRANDRIEQDWVVVMLDRSASMSIADAPAEAGDASRSPARISRERQMSAAIGAAWPQLAEMMDERTVLWLGFDSGVYDLHVTEADGRRAGIETGSAVGRRTAIGASLDQALSRAAARPVSGVAILSDGRSVDEPTRHALRRLQAERIPVLTVPLGSSAPLADLAVARAEAPGLAFLDDHVPVAVEIERLGGASGSARGRVRLTDQTTGQVLDERELPEATEGAGEWRDGRTHITLTTRPQRAGKQTWRISLVPDVPDLIEENNFGEVALEVVDRPIRVAYFDGYPRWEFRYLKNLLLREESIASSNLLLASNRQYLQEGDVLLDALPRSAQEWAKFDVIIIGDIPPTVFSRDQLEQLREHIAVRGAGLLWIGGEGSTPTAWRDSPLADLLPFSIGRSGSLGEGQQVRPWGEPVVMWPTPGARRLNLLQLAESPDDPWPAHLSDPRTGWSRVQWSQRIDPGSVKPTAEVLAAFIPASAAAGLDASKAGRPGAELPPAAAQLATPAVLSMRYGAGRILYVATDEIWRWRYARGETLPERFWLPFIRLQGRESLARSARPALIEVSPRRPEVENPVRIAIHLLDQSLLDVAPGQTSVRIRSLDEPSAPHAELTLTPESGASSGATGRAARSFAAMWVPSEPGRYRIEPTDPLLTGIGLTADADVALPDDELRHPEADHALLARLAEQSGGQVLTTDRLSELPNLLPKREVHIAGVPDIETLWDKPLFFVLLLVLLTAEWVGRRILKLA